MQEIFFFNYLIGFYFYLIKTFFFWATYFNDKSVVNKNIKYLPNMIIKSYYL